MVDFENKPDLKFNVYWLNCISVSINKKRGLSLFCVNDIDVDGQIELILPDFSFFY